MLGHPEIMKICVKDVNSSNGALCKRLEKKTHDENSNSDILSELISS
tara:strand:+ start:275 stop:415 length:141 start_codon:yes stop_codon:yes gene_type:complete